MHKLFPTMLETPEDREIASGAVYWVVAFLFLPGLLVLSTITARDIPYRSWLDIGYHGLNFLMALFFFWRYLKESFLLVQVDTKKILGTSAICAALIVMLKVAMLLLSAGTENNLFRQACLGSMLLTEAELLYYSTFLLLEQPIFAGICFVVLCPVTISCILYASVFAPLCGRRPWLAYLVMTFLLLVIHLLMAFCLFPLKEEMLIFLVRLPIHLIACWSYEKTDCIWTPIFVIMLSNLILTGGLLLIG